MLYSSSGGSRPSRVPSEARRCEMARRPERRPSEVATTMATTKRTTVPTTTIDGLAVLSAINSSPPITAPNMTAPGGVWVTQRSGRPRPSGL